MNCAIILARSQSKRIKRKNIKAFKGKPIIYWTIKNIIDSKKFQKVIVSTDDKKIAKISKECGAEVPFLRPKKLSTDHIGTKEVMDHAISYLDKKYKKLDLIGCFYATSIFAKPYLIKKSFHMINDKINFIFLSKITNPQSFRSFILDKNYKIATISKKNNYRTQDIKISYQDLGQFYIGRYNTWKKEKEILIKNSKAIVLKNWQATDIDEIDDWKLAEKLF